MSIQYDHAWQLTLRTPQSLTPAEMRDLAFAEKGDIPGAPCELMRILEPPLMIDGSTTSMLPMQFHVIGTLERHTHVFEVGVPKETGTQTSVCFNIGTRPTGAARIEWEMQVRMLEAAVKEAGGPSRHINLRTLVTRERTAHKRKIRVVDMEHRTAEGPGYSLRTSNGDLVTIPDEDSVPFGQALRVVFKVACLEMPSMGDGLFAIGRVQYISYV